MKTQSFISVITLLLLLSPSLQAGVIPGRWEKLDSQPPGKQMIVTLNSGDRMEYTFKSSGPDDLTVTDPGGTERRVPKSEVQKIVSREKHKDSYLDGLLIGLGVGVGVAFAIGRDPDDPEAEAIKTGVAMLLGIPIGAAVGGVIDNYHRGAEVFYQAP